MDGASSEFNLYAVDPSWNLENVRATRSGTPFLRSTVPQNTLDFRNALMEMRERLTHHT